MKLLVVDEDCLECKGTGKKPTWKIGEFGPRRAGEEPCDCIRSLDAVAVVNWALQQNDKRRKEAGFKDDEGDL